MWYRESFSNCLYSTTVWGFELERMLLGGISQSFAYDNIGRLVDSKTRQSTKVGSEQWVIDVR